ncbi:hypothetical protein ACF09L_32845 [Streptomyces sp. NPDC014779]|uniref:hypothetical protein n=1 Tax=Streptomyces sp. NPDC014779 TaxID=3364911 RepID=UPI003702A88D
MNLPLITRRRAQAERDVATAGLRIQLADAQRAAQRLPQTETEMECADLRKQVRGLLASVAELRRGVPDTALLLELRRQLGVEKRANRALEQRLAELQAANSSISTLRTEADA